MDRRIFLDSLPFLSPYSTDVWPPRGYGEQQTALQRCKLSIETDGGPAVFAVGNKNDDPALTDLDVILFHHGNAPKEVNATDPGASSAAHNNDMLTPPDQIRGSVGPPMETDNDHSVNMLFLRIASSTVYRVDHFRLSSVSVSKAHHIQRPMSLMLCFGPFCTFRVYERKKSKKGLEDMRNAIWTMLSSPLTMEMSPPFPRNSPNHNSEVNGTQSKSNGNTKATVSSREQGRRNTDGSGQNQEGVSESERQQQPERGGRAYRSPDKDNDKNDKKKDRSKAAVLDVHEKRQLLQRGWNSIHSTYAMMDLPVKTLEDPRDCLGKALRAAAEDFQSGCVTSQELQQALQSVQERREQQEKELFQLVGTVFLSSTLSSSLQSSSASRGHKGGNGKSPAKRKRPPSLHEAAQMADEILQRAQTTAYEEQLLLSLPTKAEKS